MYYFLSNNPWEITEWEFKRIDHIGQEPHEQTHAALENSAARSLLLRLLMDLLQDVPMEIERRGTYLMPVDGFLLWERHHEKALNHEVNVFAICIFFSYLIKGGHQKPHPVPPESRLWWLWRYREREKSLKSLQVTIIVYSSKDK